MQLISAENANGFSEFRLPTIN
eukprot:COSAG06_NODE_41518_length_390_cov_1.237113_1_plen_21_part_10